MATAAGLNRTGQEQTMRDTKTADLLRNSSNLIDIADRMRTGVRE
jgi:hypothetical protein